MLSSRTIRAYFEANRTMIAETKDMPIGILQTFLGAAIWGHDKSDTGEPMTLQELSDRVGLTPTTISQHLRYLGYGYRTGVPGLGLVQTQEYPENRRMKTFGLTPRGRRLLERLEFILSTERR